MTARAHKGRGATSAPDGRFEQRPVELDAEVAHEKAQRVPETVVRAMPAGRIISTNNSRNMSRVFNGVFIGIR